MADPMVIVGAGQAGCQAAISLRQHGHGGEIVLFGEEPVLPYQRPPLSKAYLKGELAQERLYLRPASFYDGQNITLRMNTRIEALDPSAKTITTDGGEAVAYDKLLLATGAPPRVLSLPGADLHGVRMLRSLKHSDDLRPILSASGRIVIVGAGYIGLEVAAVARAAGREVTVLERADRVLARVASPALSDFYQGLHQRHGVEFQLGADIEGFEGENGAVSAVRLGGGQLIPCAAALVGIGAVPCTSLAEQAKLVCDNGIKVDKHARTSDPHIYAAGDCTRFPSPRYGRELRLESVPNAIEQAKVAGANMAGGSAIHDALPWFWSDQYDAKLQTVGLAEGYDRLVERGDLSAGPLSLWSFQGDRLLAVDAVNDPAAFAVAKRLLTQGTPVSPDEIADPSFDVKSLMKR